MNSRPRYSDAQRTQDSEGLLSNNDGDASSMEEGKSRDWTPAGFLTGTAPKLGLVQSVVSFVRDYWWLLTAGLLVAIVGLQLLIWNDVRARSAGGSCTQVGGDYLNKEMTFPTQVVQWKADYDYVPLNATQFLDPKVQAKWESNYPVGSGFGPDGMVYNSTSVTHQLHCVYIMGKIFSAVLTKSPNLPEPDDYEAHFLHCVDYMRQAAMCAGDLTVEPRGENGKPGPVALYNAFRGHHVCKDYSKVKSYLEEQVKAGARNILPLDD